MLRLRTSPPGPWTRLGRWLGPGLLVFAAFAFVSGGCFDQRDDDLAATAFFLFWGAVITIVSVRSYRYGSIYLRIDARGMVTYVANHVDCLSVPLHELGPLSVEIARDGMHWLKGSLENATLYEAPTRLPVEQRRILLEGLIRQQIIRQVLQTDAPGDGAYRNDPDTAFRVRVAIPDRVHLADALDALDALERDPALRDQIRTLREALRNNEKDST